MAMCETEQVIIESSTSQRYSKGRFLGKGGFARVYEFTDLTTREVFAAKVIEKSKLLKQRINQKLMSEIRIHKSLSHSNIVGFKHLFEDKDNVYLLLELCSNGTLTDLLRRRKRLSELETQFYLHKIFSALNYLHKLKVIHRDIKLGNLLLNDKLEIKVADFGLATKVEYEGETKRTVCGTPNYIAPEVLESRTGYSFTVDIWSMGVLAYTLLVGKPPFQTDDTKKTYRRIKINDYAFPEHLNISDHARDLVTKLLVLEPGKRPSIDRILEFPFFTQNAVPVTMPLSTLAVPLSPAFTGMHKEPQKAFTPHSNRKLLYESDKGKQRGILGLLSPILQRIPTLKRDKEKTHRRVIYNSGHRGGFGVHVWVKRWVDYTSKYGVGYLMSNGCTGVYFNDSTQILSDLNRSNFKYAYWNCITKKDSCESYSFGEYPEGLKKKVTLLDHFRKHLMGKEREQENEGGVFVMNWLSTSCGVVFRLSNSLMQANFKDKTELFLRSDSNTAVFIDKSQRTTSYAVGRGYESVNKELADKIQYVKDAMSSGLQEHCENE